MAEAIRSLRFQYKNKIDGIYHKVGKSVSDVEADLSSLTDADKNFNIKFLSAQIAVETTKQNKKGEFESDLFNFNVNQYLIQKVNYKLNNTSLVNFFTSDGQSFIDIIDSFSAGKN